VGIVHDDVVGILLVVPLLHMGHRVPVRIVRGNPIFARARIIELAPAIRALAVGDVDRGRAAAVILLDGREIAVVEVVGRRAGDGLRRA
jgi:hypothetical protein